MTNRSGAARKKLSLGVLADLESARSIEADWNRLADEVGAQPFGLPALALSWWEHLGSGELRIVTVRNGAGDLVGLAPLFLRQRGPVGLVSFLGNGLGAVGELLIGPSKAPVAEAMLDTIAELGGSLWLTEYRHRGGGLDELRSHDYFEVDARLRDQCPVIDLDGVESVASFLDTPSRSTLRKKLAKAVRAANGLETVELATTPEEITKLEPEIRVIYDAGEQAHPRLHLLRPPYKAFFSQALGRLASEGHLALTVLRIDGEPAAFDVHVLCGNTAYAILGRIDPGFASVSPGQLLQRWTLDAAALGQFTIGGKQIQRLDLQIGNDEYKRRWATDSYDTLTVIGARAGRLRQVQASVAALEGAHIARQSGQSVLDSIGQVIRRTKARGSSVE